MLFFPSSTDANAMLTWRRGVAVSILACQAKGRGFKSRRLRLKTQSSILKSPPDLVGFSYWRGLRSWRSACCESTLPPVRQSKSKMVKKVKQPMPTELSIRTMTRAEVDELVAWAAREGW